MEFSFCNVQNISWKIMFQELVVWLLQLWLNIIDTWLLRNVEAMVAIYMLVIEDCCGHGNSVLHISGDLACVPFCSV